MGSAVSKTELTTTSNDKGPANDKAETDGKLTVAQDIAGIVLSTLQQAAELAPVPYLKEAAGLAVALFDMVQVTSVLYFARLWHKRISPRIRRVHQTTSRRSRHWQMMLASWSILQQVFGRTAKRTTMGRHFLKI